MQSWSSPPVPSLPGEGPALRLYDTARGQVVDATPPGEARLYVCGITPYDATHLGHAATYIAFDLAQRVWRDGGTPCATCRTSPTWTIPLLERASATGVDWSDLAPERSSCSAPT
jgi:L-cysteine:1D-myo-inositol 2-amino-2-deoxy-alpha-D-glucopyranoside ligase